MALVGLWAVLAVPGTALANKPDADGNHMHDDDGGDGGNVVKSDIPAKLIWVDAGGGIKSDDGEEPEGSLIYSDADAGISCVVGRRRTIWTTVAGRSTRKMNLTLADPDFSGFIASTASGGRIDVGDNPSGEQIIASGDPLPPLPIGPTMHEVECVVALEHNVSGLGDGDPDPSVREYCDGVEGTGDPTKMCANTRFTFYDNDDNQYRISFGPGGRAGGTWPGEQYFTDPFAPPVEVTRLDDTTWTVFPTDDGGKVPGFLWFKGKKKNAPWIYVGAFDVPWSCTADSLP